MKSALVTGANKGIGFEVAKLLAQKDHYVYLGCRNKENGISANIFRMRIAPGNALKFLGKIRF